MGISFCTPIKYAGCQNVTFGQRMTERVDDYFYLSGRCAFVVQGQPHKNGSEEVVVQLGETPCWKTILKVISYATVILPLIMVMAKIILRNSYRYHECMPPQPFQPQPPAPPPQPPFQASPPQPTPPPRPPLPPATPLESWRPPRPPQILAPGRPLSSNSGFASRAPLTLVRAEKPSNLNISVLFNQRFTVRDPIVPMPTSIDTQNASIKYTWNVHTRNDGTMTTSSMAGRINRINMIWWESIRNDVLTHVDSTQAVCVKRSEVREFLRKTLEKLGVQDREHNAFANYWQSVFENDYDLQSAPYILIQPVLPSDLRKYLPEMEVSGPDAAAFDLQRFYFRFEPISQPNQGMSSDSYFESLNEADLGRNVVIDLGGEVVESPSIHRSSWDESAFNAAFIKEHIYAA